MKIQKQKEVQDGCCVFCLQRIEQLGNTCAPCHYQVAYERGVHDTIKNARTIMTARNACSKASTLYGSCITPAAIRKITRFQIRAWEKALRNAAGIKEKVR